MVTFVEAELLYVLVGVGSIGPVAFDEPASRPFVPVGTTEPVAVASVECDGVVEADLSSVVVTTVANWDDPEFI